MARVKSGPASRAKHKKILLKTKGYKHGRRTLYRQAKEAWLKAGQYSYRDRRNKKRDFRRAWITKINAAVRGHDMNYRTFIYGLSALGLKISRKALAALAAEAPAEFAKIVSKVKRQLTTLN